MHLLPRDRTLPLLSLPRLPGLQLRQSWAPSPRLALPSCSPRQRLVFLKTHKSGSSSVLSLLHRYGDRHGLRFALPARYQFGYPRLFEASRVKGYRPQGGGTQPPFHILCHHMRFNLKEVRGGDGVGGTGEKWAPGCMARTTRGGGPGLGTPQATSSPRVGCGCHKGESPVPLSSGVSCLVFWQLKFCPLPPRVYSSIFPGPIYHQCPTNPDPTPLKLCLQVPPSWHLPLRLTGPLLSRCLPTSLHLTPLTMSARF